MGWNGLWVNVAGATPFANRALRQAFNATIDRRTLVRVVFGDAAFRTRHAGDTEAPRGALREVGDAFAHATANAAEHDAIVGEMTRRAAALAKERGYAERGFRTVFNTNREAGQTVFHIHLHVLGGRSFHWPPG